MINTLLLLGMIMQTILHIGSININDNINYALLQNWQPKISTELPDGGFSHVIEEIPLRIFGDSPGEVLQAANDLADELNKVVQWKQGNGEQVVMQYRPIGAAITWQSLINDLPEGVDFMRLPITFNENLRAYEMNPVTLVAQRRGQWLSTDRSDLIVNGSFENWTGDPLTPNSWTTVQGTPAQITRNSDTDFVTHGTFSLKLDPDTGADQPVVEITQEISSSVIPHGVEVLITADVYVAVGSPSGSNPGLFVNVYGASIYDTSIPDTDGEFIQVSLTAVSGVYGSSPATDGVRINLVMLDVDDAVAYVDNIRVVATEYPDGSGDQVAADVDNGNVATLNFAAPTITIPRPVDVVVSDTLLGTNTSTSYAIINQRRGGGQLSIERFLGTGFVATWGAAFTSVVDSGTIPTHGFNVLRYTPPDTDEQLNRITSLKRDTSRSQGVPSSAVIIAKVRNNSISASHVLRLQTSRVDGIEWGKPVIIPPYQAAARPEVIMLGMVEGVPGTDVELGIRSTATGAGTLDIDTIYVVYITRHTHIIRVDKGEGKLAGSTGSFYLLRLNHNQLTLPNPTLTAISDPHSGTWSGSPQAIYVRQNHVDVCWIATGRASTANTWRQGDGSGNLIEQTWLLSRLQGVLIPQ